MNLKKGQKSRLVVTREAISEFSMLSYAQRLRWLDEMRTFLGKVQRPSLAYRQKIRLAK